MVRAADRSGSAWEFASKGDLVFAVSVDADLAEIGAVFDLAVHMAQPTVATYTRLLERPDPRVPPCTAWSVSHEAKRLLYQGDVSLCHVVDVASFTDRRSGHAEITKVLRSGNEIIGFGVVIANQRLAFSHEFLTDVLLGFSTIESTSDAILEAAHRCVELVDRLPSDNDANDRNCDGIQDLADEQGFMDPAVAWAELNRTP